MLASFKIREAQVYRRDGIFKKGVEERVHIIQQSLD